jgi:hypothetical protein
VPSAPPPEQEEGANSPVVVGRERVRAKVKDVHVLFLEAKAKARAATGPVAKVAKAAKAAKVAKAARAKARVKAKAKARVKAEAAGAVALAMEGWQESV